MFDIYLFLNKKNNYNKVDVNRFTRNKKFTLLVLN